jgi:hypothetical protein
MPGVWGRNPQRGSPGAAPVCHSPDEIFSISAVVEMAGVRER